jgi:carbon monoxide dehydrogenase subunit G
MKLEFSGAPEIAASRERVWRRLIDPQFVGRSVPGVESVEVVDPTHFKVISGFGIGSIRARLTIDGELFDIVPDSSAKMRLRGKAPGSALEVLSSIVLQEAGPGKVRLSWYASSELSGAVAKVGSRMIEGIARKLTEQFWTDFARRVEEE